MANGISLGGYSTGESSLGASHKIGMGQMKIINDLSQAQCLGNVDDIIEQH